MKKTSYLMMLLFCSNSFAGGYIDFGLGAMHRSLDGDKLSYDSNQSFLVETGIGYAWKKFDIALEGSYSVGRQSDMILDYGDSAFIKDDFNMHSFNVGPTLKYHMKSISGKWDVVPFIGGFYNYTAFENSVDLKDNTTNETEDKSHESLGYGGKLGVEFKQLTPNSSWLESVNYKLFTSYTKYKDIEGDYLDNGVLKEYKGDTPDNLFDYTVGFSIGLSIGEKLSNKLLNSVKKISKPY